MLLVKGIRTVLCKPLHDSANDHDDRPEDDTPSSPNMIRDNRDEWNGSNSAQVVASNEQAQLSSFRIVEVFFPVRQCLHAIHHRRVKAGSRFDEKTKWDK